MSGIKKAILSLILFGVIGFIAAPAFAGLHDYGTPYDSWSGTTPFSSIGQYGTLIGHIDWVVFGPDGFPFDGYSPSSNELTYVYQVYSEGTEHISTYYIPTDQPADNFSSFSDLPRGVTGQVPTYIDPGMPWWEFAGINTGGNSEGLVYSSTDVPQVWYSIILNGGMVAIAQPIPAPSAVSIPEPATLWLLIIALGLLGMRQLRRR